MTALVHQVYIIEDLVSTIRSMPIFAVNESHARVIFEEFLSDSVRIRPADFRLLKIAVYNSDKMSFQQNNDSYFVCDGAEIMSRHNSTLTTAPKVS